MPVNRLKMVRLYCPQIPKLLILLLLAVESSETNASTTGDIQGSYRDSNGQSNFQQSKLKPKLGNLRQSILRKGKGYWTPPTTSPSTPPTKPPTTPPTTSTQPTFAPTIAPSILTTSGINEGPYPTIGGANNGGNNDNNVPATGGAIGGENQSVPTTQESTPEQMPAAPSGSPPSGNNDVNDDYQSVTFYATNNSGLISGMIVGFFALTVVGLAYARNRKNQSRSLGCEVSDFYNNNDVYDEDANLCERDIGEVLSPNSSWSSSSARSLAEIAISSSHKNANGFNTKNVSSSWNKKKTSMSRLAAGATQEEFAENGMNIDHYGQCQSQSRKKKKKPSPILNAKKGSELDTNLDPIVEVSSSIASSLATDDKMVKGEIRVPKLLPELSFSSCPSDESNYHGCSYSPVEVPALDAMSPDTMMDELMTPINTNSSLKKYTQATMNSDEGSPVRRLSFATSEMISDKASDDSSDSGVKELLACERMNVGNRVLVSEEEAVKASLITFVDDTKPFDSPFDEKYGSDDDDKDFMRRTLGTNTPFDEDKENSPPLDKPKDEYDTTILVLSDPSENRNIVQR